jgi:hypothetical protein
MFKMVFRFFASLILWSEKPERSIRKISGLVILLLAGCGPSLTPQPLPTPQILEVQVTPALQPLETRFQTCIETQANAGLVVDRLPATALDPSKALAIRWGGQPPRGMYAAELAQEELVVVVNPGQQMDAISLEDLRAIYTGQMKQWPGTSDAVEAWSYPAGDDVQAVFEEAVFGSASADRQTASGQTAYWRSTSLAPDPAAVLEAVAANQNAIGYLPHRWLTDAVKEVTVDGLVAGSLRRPILAISPEEPQGLPRAWLVCVQER